MLAFGRRGRQRRTGTMIVTGEEMNGSGTAVRRQAPVKTLLHIFVKLDARNDIDTNAQLTKANNLGTHIS